jgi:putative FmdB family regulatory protein
MPIYEYQAIKPDNSCEYCHGGFEVLQQIKEKPLKMCPDCGQPVKKNISWCRAAIVENSQEHTSVKNQIKDYENSGMWSHAAELADKHSEKIKDKNLKVRALDNYKKAGYDADSLSKHAKLED